MLREALDQDLLTHEHLLLALGSSSGYAHSNVSRTCSANCEWGGGCYMYTRIHTHTHTHTNTYTSMRIRKDWQKGSRQSATYSQKQGCLSLMVLWAAYPQHTYFEKHVFLTGRQIHPIFIVIHTQIHDVC